jgi:hypothetical protein
MIEALVGWKRAVNYCHQRGDESKGLHKHIAMNNGGVGGEEQGR